MSLKLGQIKGSFGVKGEVKLVSFTDSPEDIFNFGPLIGEDGQVVLTVKSHRPVKGGFAIRAPEVITREDADALRGVTLYIDRAALPPTDEGEFYYSDLTGLQVKTTDGKNAGTIVAVHDFGAGDVLEIQPPKKDGAQAGSFFHPFTMAATPKVDIKAGRVIIHIVEAENGKDPNPSPRGGEDSNSDDDDDVREYDYD